MTRTRAYQDLINRMPAAQRARFELERRTLASRPDELLMMDLDELRRSLDVSQEDLAARLDTQQAQISRLERRSDVLISSLQRYVAALGCELEIRAVHPMGTVRIVNFMDLPGANASRQRNGSQQDKKSRQLGPRKARERKAATR